MIQPKYSPEEALQAIKLRMNYDSSKTLNENRKVINEQSTFKNYSTTMPTDYLGNRGSFENYLYNGMSKEKYFELQRTLPSKNMTLDEFMEDFRESLTNPFMVGLEVVLTSTGVGVTAVVAAYTALLAYDVYKGVTKGDWGWLNIVFDVLGIVSSGAISGTLRPIMKGAQGLKLNSLGKVLTYLSKTKIWSKIKPLLEGGITVLKSISKGIWKALDWISRKTGFRELKVAGNKVELTIHLLIDEIEQFLKKTVKFLEPGAESTLKQAVTRGLISAGFAAALPLGISVVYDKLIKPKLKGGTFEYTQLNPEDNNYLREFYVKNNKEYFPNGINKIEFASNKEKDFTTKLRIDGKMYQIVDELKYKLKKI